MPIYSLTIPDWQPPSQNEYRGKHWSKREKLKKSMAAIIGGYAYRQDVAKATLRRRLAVHVTTNRPGRLPDPDNLEKLLFDALKIAGLIVDDSAGWLDAARTVVVRGEKQETVFTFEDIENEAAHLPRLRRKVQ